MMLMRDRSGRSGRRRGSQKPGTAMVSAGGLTVGGAGDAPCGGLAGCAAAAAIVTAASMTASSDLTPPRKD